MSEWVKSLCSVWLFVTPWTVAYQASPSIGFSKQEYWSGLPFPTPGEYSQPGDQTRISCIGRCVVQHWATWEVLTTLDLTPWRPTRPSRPNAWKSSPFHDKGLECKSRKSRNTWSNRQIWPWSTEWSRAEANRVLPREYTGHSKHSFPTTQEKTLHVDITRWSTPKLDWLYSLQPKMEKLCTFSKNKTRSYCGSDHEFLIAKFRLKLKKGKTTRPCRYGLNQIPYDYTVEVRNRFKGLYLIECLMNYGQR